MSSEPTATKIGGGGSDKKQVVNEETRSSERPTSKLSSIQPMTKALQYNRRKKTDDTAKLLFVGVAILCIVILAAVVLTPGDPKGTTTNKGCALDITENCSPTERCEISTVTRGGQSHQCVPCPPNYVATTDGMQCTLDVCHVPPGHLIVQQKVNNKEGGLIHHLQSNDLFGSAVAVMGDLDGNGVEEIAVGAPDDEAEGSPSPLFDIGSVFILFLMPDYTVLRQTRIGTTKDRRGTVGGLASPMNVLTQFGASLACLGDLNGDGVPDLIVGAPRISGVFVLFMLATGEVKSQKEITPPMSRDGSPPPPRFGHAVGVVGGMEQGPDGGVDVTIAAETSIYVMRLNQDGTFKTRKQVPGVADGGVAGVGDVDGNGVVDIVMGNRRAYDKRGAVYVYLMQEGGEILSEQEISSTKGGLSMQLSEGEGGFGSSVAGIGDVDGDGTPDLAVGAQGNGRIGAGSGKVYILLLEIDGSVRVSKSISGGVTDPMLKTDRFGSAIATLVGGGGETEAKGTITLVVGAAGDRDTVEGGGAVYIITIPPSFIKVVCPGDKN